MDAILLLGSLGPQWPLNSPVTCLLAPKGLSLRLEGRKCQPAHNRGFSASSPPLRRTVKTGVPRQKQKAKAREGCAPHSSLCARTVYPLSGRSRCGDRFATPQHWTARDRAVATRSSRPNASGGRVAAHGCAPAGSHASRVHCGRTNIDKGCAREFGKARRRILFSPRGAPYACRPVSHLRDQWTPAARGRGRPDVAAAYARQTDRTWLA